MRRRGQAALEYLVTYGWGILAILIVIGALGYFGFLSPSRYMPESCSFGAQLQCVDYLVRGATDDDNGQVSLRLQNNLGDEITLTGAWSVDGPLVISRGEDPDRPADVRIAAGNVSDPFNLTLPLDDDKMSLAGGDRAQVVLVIEFQRTNPVDSPKHNVTGAIFGTSQEPPEGSMTLPPGSDPPDPGGKG